MSLIDSSNQRLDAALAQLEQALQVRLEVQNGAAVNAARGQLETEMAAVRTECASLKETSSAVSHRLDAAISQIKGILAE